LRHECFDLLQIVQLVLGRGTHPALVQRSPTLLRLLAQHDSLSPIHLDLLWKSSIGTHEVCCVRIISSKP